MKERMADLIKQLEFFQ